MHIQEPEKRSEYANAHQCMSPALSVGSGCGPKSHRLRNQTVSRPVNAKLSNGHAASLLYQAPHSTTVCKAEFKENESASAANLTISKSRGHLNRGKPLDFCAALCVPSIILSSPVTQLCSLSSFATASVVSCSPGIE